MMNWKLAKIPVQNYSQRFSETFPEASAEVAVHEAILATDVYQWQVLIWINLNLAHHCLC